MRRILLYYLFLFIFFLYIVLAHDDYRCLTVSYKRLFLTLETVYYSNGHHYFISYGYCSVYQSFDSPKQSISMGYASCSVVREENEQSVVVKEMRIPMERNSHNTTNVKSAVGRVMPTSEKQNKLINPESSKGVNAPIRSRLVGRIDREKGVRRFFYDKCDQKREIDKSDKMKVDSSVTDVTFVTVGSFNRLFILPILASRWNGPVVVVVYLKEKEVVPFELFLKNETNRSICSDRFRILSYVVTEDSFFYNNFPINILRNMGITHTHTTHFVLFDIDMWPSKNSYEHLKEIPSLVLNDPHNAIVIPSFFHTGWAIANGTLEEQVNSIRHRIPYTIDDLVACSKKRKCHYGKKHLFTHLYVPSIWYKQQQQENPPLVYKYTCWKNKYQEPYLMVRRNDSITRFHEGFINYGFNKISYVETLRLSGYSFYLASKMYAFDLPHHPSAFQQLHLHSKHNGNYQTHAMYMHKLKSRVKPEDLKLPLCSPGMKFTEAVYKTEDLLGY